MKVAARGRQQKPAAQQTNGTSLKRDFANDVVSALVVTTVAQPRSPPTSLPGGPELQRFFRCCCSCFCLRSRRKCARLLAEAGSRYLSTGVQTLEPLIVDRYADLKQRRQIHRLPGRQRRHRTQERSEVRSRSCIMGLPFIVTPGRAFPAPRGRINRRRA